VYLKSRKFSLFLQAQLDFALNSLEIHKGFLRLFSSCFPFLMWVKYGTEQKGTGKRIGKKRGLLLAKWQSKKTPFPTGFLVQPIPRDLGRQSPGTNSGQVS